MYLFGGTIVTLFKTLDKLFTGQYIEAAIQYYIHSALPPTSLEHVLGQAVLGAIVASLFWLIGMVGFHGRFSF